MTETWKPVVDYQEIYEVSTLGRVKRVGHGQGTSSGRILKQSMSPGGYVSYMLYRDGKPKRVLGHRVVALAHIENPDGLPLVRHLNSVKVDNRVENLAWGTHSQNANDAAAAGNMGRQGSCWRGHDLNDPKGFRIDSKGFKVCKKCAGVSRASRIERGLPDGDRRHGTRNGHREWGCKCEPCTSASSEYNKTFYLNAKKRGVR